MAYLLPEPATWSATELSRVIGAREMSCREVMATFLDHIDACNGRVNAIVSLRDRDDLLREAAARDRDLASGRSLGWLHGVPMAVKDLAPTAGLTTTFGSPIFADHVPAADGIMVSRLKRDGAIVIGKTNVPEFGLGSQTYNPVFGRTRNAYDPALCAGGSSGGAAAALAMRMVPVADGSDMMGSLRNPAAYGNVFGLRPTFGRVPGGPAPDVFGQQVSTEGPMARNAADLGRLLATQAGPHPDVPLSLPEDPDMVAGTPDGDIAGTRLAWMGDWDGYFPMEGGILSLCGRALDRLRGLGCAVEAQCPSFDPARLWSCWMVLRQWAVAAKLEALYADPDMRARLKPEARWEVAHGLALTAMDIHRANATRSDWYRALRGLFADYDYVALPAAQVFPFDVDLDWPRAIAGRPMDTYHRWMEIVVPGSLSGCPVLSIPAGFDDRGRPMGIQIIGRHGAEAALLRLAASYERLADPDLSRLPPGLSEAGATDGVRGLR